MFDFSFENILHSNLFNFVCLLFILGWIFSKVNLMGMFESGREKIANAVNIVESEKENSEKELEAIKQELEYLPKKIDDIFDQADDNAVKISEKVRKEIVSELQKIEEVSKKQTERERAKVEIELTKHYIEKVVAELKSDIKSALSQDSDLHKKLNNNFIDKLEKMEVQVGTDF